MQFSINGAHEANIESAQARMSSNQQAQLAVMREMMALLAKQTLLLSEIKERVETLSLPAKG